MALALSPALAQTPEPSGVTATAAVISSVAITQAPERAAVRVEGEGLLEVHAVRLQSPERLVLDFAGARLHVDKTLIPGVAAPVRGVRLGQYRPDVARIVVDLTDATPYQIARDGSAVVIYFDAQPAAPAPVAAKTTSTTSNEMESQSNEKAARPQFHDVKVKPRAITGTAKSLQISAPHFALPAELTHPAYALGSFGSPNQPARPDTSVQQAAQQAIREANTAASTMAAQTPAAQAPSVVVAAPTGKYTGEPISVNLKDVDLRDFFRLIHEISGLNVVLDPAVKGTLTIVLDEVPWDQALDIVLQNNGLDKQLNGNVLRIATRDTLKREAETQRDLEKARADATTPVTVTRVLSYAKASSLKDTLKKFLSSRGDILSDDRSNQLIIRDIPQVIPTVDNLIRQLDRKSQQVEIEARVVAASRSFAQDIGTELGFAGSTTGGRSLFSGDPLVGGSGVTTAAGIPVSPVTVSSTGGVTPAGHQPERRRADFRPRVYVPIVKLRCGLLHFRGGSQRRRQTAFQASGGHAEQREGHGQARYKNSYSDHHQQHHLRAIYRCRVEAGGHSADHRGRHHLHGRAGGKYADRHRYSPRAGHSGAGHAVGGNQSAGCGWRHGGHRRHHRLTADRKHSGSSLRWQFADHRLPVQAHQRQCAVAGIAVLPDAAHYSWVAQG
jgi:type IV pilus assembly protein PilQ